LFNSYLKVSEGEQLSSKLLAKLSSNLSKPRKPRRLVPLGKDAICLTDSRGRQTKHASKGFQNLFKVSENPGDSLSKVEDDIIARLNNRENSDRKFVDHLGIQYESNDGSELGNITASARPQRKARGTARAKQGSSKSDSNYKNFYGEDIGKSLGKFSYLYNGITTSNLFLKGDIPILSGDSDCDIQSKLIAVWDLLQISSQERLNFMAKYSSNVYAAEMGMAVDLWAAIATEFTFIFELHTLFKKAHVSYDIFEFLTLEAPTNYYFRRCHYLCHFNAQMFFEFALKRSPPFLLHHLIS
jgi:hypothetical protein